MKRQHSIPIMLLCFMLSCMSLIGQGLENPDTNNPITKSKFSMGLTVGYDIPTYNFNFTHLDYDPGLAFGLFGDYRLYGNLGLGLDYDLIFNSPTGLISQNVAYPIGLSATTTNKVDITRHFIGLGPSYDISLLDNKLSINLALRGGISLISGGDISVSSINPVSGTRDYHLVQTGFEDNAISGKAKIRFDYFITPSLGINLGAYHMRHYSVHADDIVDVDNIGNVGLVYGSNDFDISSDQYALSSRDALVITEKHCNEVTSFGAHIGLTYRLGVTSKVEKEEQVVETIVTGNKLLVTVKDGPSGQFIPDADVVVRDTKGNIVSTGTSNSYGLVELTNIEKGDYVIEGKVAGVSTSTANLYVDDFSDQVIKKEILYEDLRFILKGVAVNKATKYAEPNVVVNLTNKSNRKVTQDNTNGKGQFEFQLDPNSTYEVVGIKENRLSDIDRASTVGLTRSTTLFVELQLGLDDFDCGRGTVMDIKYEYDKADLLPESKFELDRLVRYMSDHGVSKVELSAHTDARGSNDYNLSLSDRRARSAADYIVSRGISRSRIVSQGYGETRLLNHCKDGVNCSEEQHKINRRTEAKLLCR